MKLDPIAMDRSEARRAFLEYRNAVRARHNDEDAEIMRGYRALAKGLQLIKLSDVMKAGGTIEHSYRAGWSDRRYLALLPRIAVVRACARECWCEVRSDGSLIFSEEERRTSARQTKAVRRFGAGTIPERPNNNGRFKAIVPTVPPRFRPAHALSNYHILFEAEWQAVPPRDPALLKHIGGDLYAVLATWDLTEVERAVLQQRVTA
jgi:hypothetical protein